MNRPNVIIVEFMNTDGIPVTHSTSEPIAPGAIVRKAAIAFIRECALALPEVKGINPNSAALSEDNLIGYVTGVTNRRRIVLECRVTITPAFEGTSNMLERRFCLTITGTTKILKALQTKVEMENTLKTWKSEGDSLVGYSVFEYLTTTERTALEWAEVEGVALV